MPDLEEKIAVWRRQMLAAGIKSPVPLEELESHLRDDVEERMRSGLNAQQAFEIAVRKIGRADALQKEFSKASKSAGVRLVKLAGIACLVIAGFFSLLIFPKLFHHAMGWMPKMLGLAAIVTTVLTWRYGYRLLPVIRNRRVRTAIGAACCLAGVIGMMLFIKFIPHFFDHRDSEIPVGQLLVSFLWAWTAMAILGGIAYGLEKAVRKNNEQYV